MRAAPRRRRQQLARPAAPAQPAPQHRRSRIASLAELPPELRSGLPTLAFSGSESVIRFAEANRLLIVNGPADARRAESLGPGRQPLRADHARSRGRCSSSAASARDRRSRQSDRLVSLTGRRKWSGAPCPPGLGFDAAGSGRRRRGGRRHRRRGGWQCRRRRGDKVVYMLPVCATMAKAVVGSRPPEPAVADVVRQRSSRCSGCGSGTFRPASPRSGRRPSSPGSPG